MGAVVLVVVEHDAAVWAGVAQVPSMVVTIVV